MEVLADEVLPDVPIYEEVDAFEDLGLDRQDGRYTASTKNAGVATAKALATIKASESQNVVKIGSTSRVMANGQSSLQARNKPAVVTARKSSPNPQPAQTVCPQQQPSQFGGGSSSVIVCNGINRINTEKPLLDWKDIQAAMEGTSGECWIILFGTFVSLPAAERKKISPLVTFSQLSLPVISECRNIPVKKKKNLDLFRELVMLRVYLNHYLICFRWRG
jgi:hypothetical protein